MEILDGWYRPSQFVHFAIKMVIRKKMDKMRKISLKHFCCLSLLDSPACNWRNSYSSIMFLPVIGCLYGCICCIILFVSSQWYSQNRYVPFMSNEAAGMVQWLACRTCEPMVPGLSLLRVWVYLQRVFQPFSLAAWLDMTYDAERAVKPKSSINL